MLTATMAWAGITVGVPVQLVNGDGSRLPDKSIEVTHKQLKIVDNAPAAIVAAIDSVTHIVSDNAGNGRTYSLVVSPRGNQVDVYNLDPLEPMDDRFTVAGTYVMGHFHFLVMGNGGNQSLIDTVFKTTRDKVTYVREFEYVDEESTPLSTHVSATIVAGKVLFLSRLVEDMEAE